MEIPDLALGPEWTLLELLCLGLTTPREQERFEELVRSDDLHWGELLEQALRHKMLPTLAFYVSSAELEDVVPPLIMAHLQSLLDLNRRKIAIFRKEAARIVRAFDEQGTRFAARKGITLESTLYKGNGNRRLRDLDFMIAPGDRDAVTNVMSDLGYQIGYYDWYTNAMKPLTRREMVTYRLNPDHMPMFALATSDPVVRYIDVDFACSLTWSRSPFDVPIETALAEIFHQPIPGFSDVELPCFSPVFQFIDVILHLFREAWVEGGANWKKDITLMQFGDVIHLWRANQETFKAKGLVQTLERFEIVDPVLWVLEHTDRTFHTSITSALGLKGRVTESWLASARAPGDKLREWKGSMRERLHCKDRRKLFMQ